LSREKGINPEIVVAAVEDAIVVATRKFYKTQESLRAVLDRETGAIRAYSVKEILPSEDDIEDPQTQISLEEALRVSEDAVVGGELLEEKSIEGLGRIAAQLAKQVIFQKVREAERDTVFNEYHNRVGEVVNATVKRIEGPDYIFDLGKAEARMSRKEQSRLESFAVGERVRVVITRVEKATKGPGVVVSRAAPELVTSLFQSEVPEIYDNTVVIRAIAREAGERTKIAVMSRDKDVDAVGACVGMKGMRVQSIIRELRGEKIDIIEFNDDAVVFATHALSPAKISRVSIIDPVEKHMEVIVDDSQLSLAIGKKGQNVRLAAKLLGWKNILLFATGGVLIILGFLFIYLANIKLPSIDSIDQTKVSQSTKIYDRTGKILLYDIFQDRKLKAHLALPEEGPPTWDYSPDDVGGQWMDDALREGIVATITDAPCEEAWYYGELTILPHRTALEG
jgi:N utilization substance protein A